MLTQSYAIHNEQQDDKCVVSKLFIPDIAQYGTLHIKRFLMFVLFTIIFQYFFLKITASFGGGGFRRHLCLLSIANLNSTFIKL